MIHTSRQARQLFLTLLGIESLLVVAYATDSWVRGPSGELHAVIDLDGEGNLPAWFSSFQLSLVAITFWFMAARARTTQRPSRRFLRACSGLFLLLSIDETAMIHERITAWLGSRYIDWVPAWICAHPIKSSICAIVVVACAAAAAPHVRAFERANPTAVRIAAVGLLVYVTGGAVLESAGYETLIGGSHNSLYPVEVASEEFLEMLGVSLVLYSALLLCCKRMTKSRSGPKE
jgi:hypothetical protein